MRCASSGPLGAAGWFAALSLFPVGHPLHADDYRFSAPAFYRIYDAKTNSGRAFRLSLFSDGRSLKGRLHDHLKEAKEYSCDGHIS